MMTDHYVQTLSIDAPKKERIKHTAGTVLKLMALGLIVVALFASYYAFIAVAVLFVLGIALCQVYNNNAKEYEYDFNTLRIVISKTNMLGKRERKLEVVFDDVTNFCPFTDIISADDLIFCQSAGEKGVYALTFLFEQKERRLLFQPDTYFVALIEETLTTKKDGDCPKTEKEES